MGNNGHESDHGGLESHILCPEFMSEGNQKLSEKVEANTMLGWKFMWSEILISEWTLSLRLDMILDLLPTFCKSLYPPQVSLGIHSQAWFD